MKRILFYESRPEWGGAQKCELDLLVSLDDESMETYFLTSTDGPMNSRVQAAGKEVTLLPILQSVNQIRKDQVQTGLFFMVRQLLALVPHFFQVMLFILRNRIDIVYTSQFRSQLIIGWLAKLLGRKVIWHIHGEEQLTNLLGKISVLTADRIIVVSQALCEKYRSQFPKRKEKISFVHNGVEISAIDRQEAPTFFTMVTVGTLIEGKRQDLAIQACAELIKLGYPVQLKIIGEKPPWHSDEYKLSLQRLVNEHGISSSVSFLGWIEQPWEEISRSSVFVLPSDTEGMPLSILEAMALGLPSISTNVGGVPEVIEDGTTGFIIPPGSVEELVEKLKILLDQPSVRDGMAKKARQRYESHFTKESFVKGVVGVIHTLA